YGRHARSDPPREVVVKIAVRHSSKDALDIFSREVYPAATATVQGVAGFFGGRPKVQPVVRLYSFLIDKARVPATVMTDQSQEPVLAHIPDVTTDANAAAALPSDEQRAPGRPPSEPTVTVPLITLAWARSG